MGDRCSISINIHGHIETVEVMRDIVETIQSEGMHSETYGPDEEDIRSEFLHSLGEMYPPQFHDHDCNYANIDDLKSVLQDNGIPYSGSHDAGGGYSAATFSFYPAEGYFESVTDDNGPSVSLHELRKAMSERRRIDAVWALIHHADKANGIGLPKFTVSEAVRQYLAGEE